MLLQNLEMASSSTARWDFSVLDGSTKLPIDLTGAKIWFTAKRKIEDVDADSVFQKIIGTGVTVVDAPNGVAYVELLSSDTSSILVNTTLFYDLKVKTATGKVFQVAHGKLVVDGSVTRSLT